jgi:hypothetical protein
MKIKITTLEQFPVCRTVPHAGEQRAREQHDETSEMKACNEEGKIIELFISRVCTHINIYLQIARDFIFIYSLLFKLMLHCMNASLCCHLLLSLSLVSFLALALLLLLLLLSVCMFHFHVHEYKCPDFNYPLSCGSKSEIRHSANKQTNASERHRKESHTQKELEFFVANCDRT